MPGLRGRRARGRPALATAGAALALLTAGTYPTFADSTSSGSRDIQLVYCLDSAHRGDLVAAAVRLMLLRPDSAADPGAAVHLRSGGHMALETWAARRVEDFGRACEALMAADSPPPATATADGSAEDDWFTGFLKEIPLLAAGALLTLGGQQSERRVSEIRLFKSQLGAEEKVYRTAVREYLTRYEQDPHTDHRAVRTARETLAATLSRAPGPSVRQAAAQQVAEGLPLGRALSGNQAGALLGPEARAGEAERASALVDRRLRQISELNRSSLYWLWLTVRTKLAQRAAGGAA
ncbi:hypothetical protein [Streptomyces sp. NPDC006879]|uniref:hypothetical protein n=1 Tax=Streptomyces sp. NPDC006879 TaxID=3364767 RepID=UPI0036853D34